MRDVEVEMYKRKRLYVFIYVTVLIIVIVNCLIFLSFVGKKHIQSSLYGFNTKKMVSQSDEPICETIHIGFVCTGYSENLKIYTLLKSLFFYRSKPIHFHAMVDDVSLKPIKTLFETWNVPQVKITYYSAPMYKSNMSWPNKEVFLNSNGYVKLLLSSVVPTHLTEKIIIIDTDLTFSADVYELWTIFDQFNVNQAIGLAKSQSKVVNSTIVSYQYNTGVTLYHLKRLQKIGWYSTWIGIAKSIIRYETKHQDIINIILKPNSTLIYVLPCEWNIQLSEARKTSKCFMNNKIKVVHKYFGNKLDSMQTPDENSFLSLHTMFSEYSGNLLRYRLYQCEKSVTPPKQNSSENPCKKFDDDINLNRRTLMYFRNFEYTPTKHDVTLVTQFSYEKLIMLEHISKRWNGPISFTFYVSDYELQRCIYFIENSKALNNRSDIAYTAVFREGQYYPINDLRNISMRTVSTPYIFLVDMDLLPPTTLYENLKSVISKMKDMSNKALVVPAFETKTTFPNSKKEAVEMLDKDTLRLFHKTYLPAYGPTNYTKWRTAVVPYAITYQLYFEPYIVVQSNVSEYDRRFIGFGFNKASHALLLSAQKYQFFVLPDVFVTHKHHLPSSGLKENQKSRLYRKCKIIRMKEFSSELKSKYNVTYVIKQ